MTREAEDAAALQALAADCGRAGVTRQVLLLRLSLLPAESYRPHYGRLAEAALEALAQADRARLYRLPGHDRAVSWRGETAAEQEALDALATLFSGAMAGLPPFRALVRRFLLPRDARALGACLAGAPAAVPAPAPSRPAIDLPALGRIERALASADMACFARHRPVCRRDGRGRWRLEWERRFLAVGELARALAPEHDLMADPWLFRRLTRTLDRRMLALLADQGEIGRAPPFAFALNVESILSSAFLAFDAALPASLRGKVLLTLSPADILADAAAFLFARDFARGRGYRLLLSEVTESLLPALAPGRLGLDFLELQYAPALSRLPEDPDPARVILSHADAEEALAWGEAQGVSLFEGALAEAAI